MSCPCGGGCGRCKRAGVGAVSGSAERSPDPDRERRKGYSFGGGLGARLQLTQRLDLAASARFLEIIGGTDPGRRLLLSIGLGVRL